MGYQTTINFSNDSYGEIKKNPQQVIDNILDAMDNSYTNMKVYTIGNFVNPMVASKSKHVDIPRLYIAWRNLFVELGVNNDIKNLEIRKEFLSAAQKIITEEIANINKTEQQLL